MASASCCAQYTTHTGKVCCNCIALHCVDLFASLIHFVLSSSDVADAADLSAHRIPLALLIFNGGIAQDGQCARVVAFR